MSRRAILPAVSILTAGLLILSGCATAVPSGDAPTPQPTVSLEGTGWVLDTMAGEPPLEGTTLTLQFASEGTLSGSSGCNRYQTTYETTGDALDVGEVSGTLMACEQPVSEQESSFITMLTGAERFAIEEDHLTLSDGSGEATLVFSAQSQELQGGTWMVTGYNDGAEAVVSVLNDTVAEVSFDEDGTISGTGGCNRFTGQFTADDGTLEIGALALTRMACPEPEGVMGQETALLAALESASGYELEGDGLRLTTDGGATAATLTRG